MEKSEIRYVGEVNKGADDWTVEINGKLFIMEKEVFELLLTTSLERDFYRKLWKNPWLYFKCLIYGEI